MTGQPLVLPLAAPDADLALVGGKGASLARLAVAGLPVPPWFHVTTAAYRDFVSGHGLREQILAAVTHQDANEGARRVGELFAAHDMPDATAEAIRKAYVRLDGGDTPVAVRSSATADDLPGMSFAGQQDTYLTIRGRFDPFRWAADPNMRSDVFDEHGDEAPPSDVVKGFPGATGVVEGAVLVLAGAEEGDQLLDGEILVTTVTNVGWTPLFPRAAAVVTDVGAPLSHAAFVARELGVPAVVGCGNATMRLRTGDRVRVDGERGIVEVLVPVDSHSEQS